MPVGSFVIVRITTNEPIAEVFSTKVFWHLNYKKVKVVPILEWLQSVNGA